MAAQIDPLDVIVGITRQALLDARETDQVEVMARRPTLESGGRR